MDPQVRAELPIDVDHTFAVRPLFEVGCSVLHHRTSRTMVLVPLDEGGNRGSDRS